MLTFEFRTMKTLYTILLSIFFFAYGYEAVAQSRRPESQFMKNLKHSINKSPWIAGIGWNVIDDDGKPFNKLFSAKNSWNVLPYPSKISCEKGLIQGWSVEAAANYNQFKDGKIVNNDLVTTTKSFISVDINAKFSFSEFMKKKSFFDPYLLHGYGFTWRDMSKHTSVATLNIGLGFNCWLYNDIIGINVQSQAKFALTTPFIKTSANYLQHSLGIVYKIQAEGRGKKPGRTGTRYKFFKTRTKTNT